jgi:uncharacterized protein YoxC
MTSIASIRNHLQKCNFWVDSAIQKSNKLYFKTPEWKKAIHYAKKAKDQWIILKNDDNGSSGEWSFLEKRILDRGYPVLVEGSELFSRCSSPVHSPPSSATHTIDPLEKLQQEVDVLTADKKELLNRLNTIHDDMSDRHNRSIETREKEKKDLENKLRLAEEQTRELEEQLSFSSHTHHKNTVRLEKIIHELQSEVEAFRRISGKAVELLSPEQKEELHAFLEEEDGETA